MREGEPGWGEAAAATPTRGEMGRPGLGASRRTWTRCSSPTPCAPTSPRASSPSPRNSSRRSALTTRPRYELRFWRKGSSRSLARRGRRSCPASSAVPSHLCRPARRTASTPTAMTREDGAMSGRRRTGGARRDVRLEAFCRLQACSF